jgi:hypothetical protein
VTILELVEFIREEIKMKHRKEDDEELCPICRCELYDGVHEMLKKGGEDEKIIELNKLQLS